MIHVGILTVSDRRFRNKGKDESGLVLARLVRGQGWSVAAAVIVPDERARIGKVIRAWCDRRKIDLLLTTGGTGLGPRDITPEATRPLLDKELPGLSERMRSEGMRKTPFSALSRALAGSRKGCLIVNLPGSPQGAEESFFAIRDVIPHALDMLRGGGHKPKN